MTTIYMLEAARWAASSYNLQPWRFIYTLRDKAHWHKLLDLLVPSNRAWAKDASALVIIVSNTLMRPLDGDKDLPSPTHSFDAGTASRYFSLQACLMGWFVHGMVGFDSERAYSDLKVPQGYKIEAAYVVGRLGDPGKLGERLRAREYPSERLPLVRLAFEGCFKREEKIVDDHQG